MKKTISTWSPVGGIGSTFLNIMLCRALSSEGKRVVLLDFDLKTPSLALYFQSEDIIHTLDNILPFTAGLSLTPEILESNLQKFENFHYLRGTNQPEQAFYLEIENLVHVIDVATEMFDYCIIDSHSIIDNVGTYVALDKADIVFLTLDKNVINIRHYDKVKSLLVKHYDLTKFSLIVNRTHKNNYMGEEDMVSHIGLSLAGTLPDLSFDLINNLNKGKLEGSAKMEKIYKDLMEKIIKEKINPEVKTQKRGLFSLK